MLSTASDYTYNATNLATDGVDIQGRIIPTEDIDGLPHPLRRENYAYLSEALSERYTATFWSVPQRTTPRISDVKNWWLVIKDFYTNNYANNQSWHFVKPDAVLPAKTTTNTNQQWVDVYLEYILGVTDLPTTMRCDTFYDLYADDIRTLFWAVNQLRRQVIGKTIPSGGSLTITPGKSGGSMSVDAVLFDPNASDPYAPIPLHQSQPISGVSTSDTTISGTVTGGSGDPLSYSYRLLNNDLYRYYQARKGAGAWNLDGSEVYYSGSVIFTFSYPQKCPSNFEFFVELSVQGGTAANHTSCKAWVPVSATMTRNNDGDVTAITFPVDLTWLHSVVQLMDPAATFAYDSVLPEGDYRQYYIQIHDYVIVGYPDYKSLLPADWTWTP